MVEPGRWPFRLSQIFLKVSSKHSSAYHENDFITFGLMFYASRITFKQISAPKAFKDVMKDICGAETLVAEI